MDRVMVGIWRSREMDGLGYEGAGRWTDLGVEGLECGGAGGWMD